MAAAAAAEAENNKESKPGFGNLLAWKMSNKAMHNDYANYTANIEDMPDAANNTTEIVDVGHSGQPIKPVIEEAERDYNEMLSKETPSIVNGFEVVKGKQRARKKQTDKLQTRIAFPKGVPQKRTHQQAFMRN